MLITATVLHWPVLGCGVLFLPKAGLLRFSRVAAAVNLIDCRLMQFSDGALGCVEWNFGKWIVSRPSPPPPGSRLIWRVLYSVYTLLSLSLCLSLCVCLSLSNKTMTLCKIYNKRIQTTQHASRFIFHRIINLSRKTKTIPTISKCQPGNTITNVWESSYNPRALNTGTCISHRERRAGWPHLRSHTGTGVSHS